jgi:hypothetical protein
MDLFNVVRRPRMERGAQPADGDDGRRQQGGGDARHGRRRVRRNAHGLPLRWSAPCCPLAREPTKHQARRTGSSSAAAGSGRGRRRGRRRIRGGLPARHPRVHGANRRPSSRRAAPALRNADWQRGGGRGAPRGPGCDAARTQQAAGAARKRRGRKARPTGAPQRFNVFAALRCPLWPASFATRGRGCDAARDAASSRRRATAHSERRTAEAEADGRSPSRSGRRQWRKTYKTRRQPSASR